jgi:hypothetical protein
MSVSAADVCYKDNHCIPDYFDYRRQNEDRSYSYTDLCCVNIRVSLLVSIPNLLARLVKSTTAISVGTY